MGVVALATTSGPAAVLSASRVTLPMANRLPAALAFALLYGSNASV